MTPQKLNVTIKREASMLHVWDAPGYDLGPETAIVTEVYHVLPLSLHTNTWSVL
jgi:hypothetical protein